MTGPDKPAGTVLIASAAVKEEPTEEEVEGKASDPDIGPDPLKGQHPQVPSASTLTEASKPVIKVLEVGEEKPKPSGSEAAAFRPTEASKSAIKVTETGEEKAQLDDSEVAESECQLCLRLAFPQQQRLFSDALRRRGHVSAHWSAEGTPLAAPGPALVWTSGSAHSAPVRRLLFACFPAVERLYDLPQEQRHKSLLFGTVPSDLRRKGWDWDGRKAMPPPKDRPRFFPSRQLTRASVPDPAKYHFCAECGRGSLKGGGKSLEHLLEHQDVLFVRCPVDGCAFGHRGRPSAVRGHIASAHPTMAGLVPLDERAKRWDEILPLARRLFPGVYARGRSLTDRKPAQPWLHPSSLLVTRANCSKPELYDFCQLCDRGLRKHSKQQVSHAVAHQDEPLVFCPAVGCEFSSSGDLGVVRGHIASAHSGVEGLRPRDERKRSAKAIAQVRRCFPGLNQSARSHSTEQRKAPRRAPKACLLCSDRVDVVSMVSHAGTHVGKGFFFCSACPWTVNYRFKMAQHCRQLHGRRDGFTVDEVGLKEALQNCFGQMQVESATRRDHPNKKPHGKRPRKQIINDPSKHLAPNRAPAVKKLTSKPVKRLGCHESLGSKAAPGSKQKLRCGRCRHLVSPLSLRNHALGHFPSQRSFRCSACPFSTNHEPLAKTHIRIAHKGNTQAKVEGESGAAEKLEALCFPRAKQETLIKARLTTPRKPRRIRRASKNPQTHVRCGKCGRELRKLRGSLYSHALTHLGFQTYGCSACPDFTSWSHPAAIKHVEQEHGATTGPKVLSNAKRHRDSVAEFLLSAGLASGGSRRGDWECRGCGARLRAASRLQHALRHLGLTNYACSACHSQFHKPKDAEGHVRAEHGELEPRPVVLLNYHTHRHLIQQNFTKIK